MVERDRWEKEHEKTNEVCKELGNLVCPRSSLEGKVKGASRGLSILTHFSRSGYRYGHEGFPEELRRQEV